MYFKCII